MWYVCTVRVQLGEVGLAQPAKPVSIGTSYTNATYEIIPDGKVLPVCWRQTNTWATANAFSGAPAVSDCDRDRSLIPI